MSLSAGPRLGPSDVYYVATDGLLMEVTISADGRPFSTRMEYKSV